MEFEMELKQISKIQKEDKEEVKLILRDNSGEIDGRLEVTMPPHAFKDFAEKHMLTTIGATITIILKQKQTKLGEE